MQSRETIDRLRKFVKKMVRSRVKDKAAWKRWRIRHEAFLEECFGYDRKDGMPSITALVSPFFHTELPLIGLNYSPVAHNTLFAYPDGWTEALRACRGIVFDRKGNLVALPFEKFFNYGEQPETTDIPDGSFVATVKHDGHLGIVFLYEGEFILTTRGSFVSRSSILGNEMLKEIAKKRGWHKGWNKDNLSDLTVLVEIIHPSTRVHVKYRGRPHLKLIGARNTRLLSDHDYGSLCALARHLKLQITEAWQGESIDELRAFMQDLTVANQEGFVARFQSGLRVKFKFASYINLMVAEKLSHTYIMNRIMSGNLEKMIGNLQEEILNKARTMVAELVAVGESAEPIKDRRKYLYGLVPDEKSTPYYRTICRKFITHLDAERGCP